jgi:large subunit ribosomal protein L9
LFPKNLVLVATDPNLRQIELAQKKAQAALALEKKRAQEMAQRLKNVSLTLSAEVNEDGKLYGSLTAADIAQAISQDTGLEIGKKSVVLETPIKELGIYELDVKLHADVVTKVKVWVVKK